MVFVYALIIWASLGTISASIHMFFVWRSLSGREGAESVVITRTHATPSRRDAQVDHDQPCQ